MKSLTEIKTVRDKIRFFDDFVLGQIGVDPRQVRENARKAAALKQIQPEETPPPLPNLNPGAMVEKARDAALEAMEDRDEPVDDGLGLGLVGKKLGQKYVGEEKGEGWRAAQTADSKNDEVFKTRHFDDRQREKSKLEVGQDGRGTSGIGIDTDEDDSGARQEMGFVMNPKTGETHLFRDKVKESYNPNTGKTEVIHTHHSSPLAGGDVAGAGRIQFDDDARIDLIKDQSGHYKPEAEITFQAVRQLSVMTLSEDIQKLLRKRGSTLGQEEGGTAESPDSVEQLIAAELGVAREAFFAALDAEQESLAREAETIRDQGQREARIEQINLARRDAASAFREVAAEVEAGLRKRIGDARNGALLQSDTPHTKRNDNVEALRQAAKTLRKAIEDMQDREPGDGPDYIDPAVLEAKLRQIETMRQVLAPDEFAVHEAKVSLLGKTGALSEDEYKAASDAASARCEAREKAGETLSDSEVRGVYVEEMNRASVLKQLREPLGGAALGQLINTGKLGEEMNRRGLDAGEPGAVDKLRDLLGQEAVERIKGDPDEVAQLAAQHNVKRLDSAALLRGVENLGFRLGEETSQTMYASQFLQTGGNERQIRAKSAVLREIGQGGAKKLRTTDSKAAEEIEAKRQAMEDGGRDSELVAAMRDRSPDQTDDGRRDELITGVAEAEAAHDRAPKELEDLEDLYRNTKLKAKKMKRDIEDAADELERMRNEGIGDGEEALRTLAADLEALQRDYDRLTDEVDDLKTRKEDLEDDMPYMGERLEALRGELGQIARRIENDREVGADDLLDDDPVLGKLKLNDALRKLESDIKKLEMQLGRDDCAETDRRKIAELLVKERGKAEKLYSKRTSLDQTPTLRIPVLRRQLDTLVSRIEQASGDERAALVAKAAPLRAEMEQLLAAG